MKELVMAGILISLSTVLKVCCVVALCSAEIQYPEPEHDHHDKVILAQKKNNQTSEQPVMV